MVERASITLNTYRNSPTISRILQSQFQAPRFLELALIFVTDPVPIYGKKKNGERAQEDKNQVKAREDTNNRSVKKGGSSLD